MAAFDGTIRIDTRIATDNVQKDFRGMNAPLKKMGTAIAAVFSVAAVAAFVKNAVNSFSWLSSQYGTNIRALEISFTRLQGVIAMIFDNIISAAAPYIINFIQWLITGLVTIAQWVQGILQVFLGVVGAVNAATDAQGRLTGQTDRWRKSAAGALASFDELKVLNQQPTIPNVEVPPGMLGQIEGFKNQLTAFLQPAIDAFENLKTTLAPLGQTIWSGLKWAWDNILLPFGTWVGGKVVPAALDLLGAAGKALDGILTAAKPAFTWLWETFLQPIGKWVAQALLDTLKWLVDRLNDFSRWIKDNQSFVEGLIKFLAAFAVVWGVVTVAVTLWSTIAGIATAATAAFGAAIAFLTGPFGLILLAVIAIIAIIALLLANWDAVVAWFQGVANSIAAWFNQAGQDISRFFSSAWAGIVSAWNGAGAWFKGIADSIASWFNQAGTDISKVWNEIWTGIGNFIKGIINGVIDFINGMLSGIASGINAVISAINSLSWDVPDWVPLIGGQHWGFNIGLVGVPQIPHLATGAVIPPNAAFAAVLGDQRSGTNIEAPEGLIRQIIQEELGSIQAQVLIEFGGSLGELVRQLRPEIIKSNIQVGRTMVPGGGIG